MGLLPLRGPPKPQPYENTKRFVRRCRSLFSSVLLSGAQGGSLSASHTNHPFCAARCLPGRRRSGRANDFYSFSSGQTACRKSCAFAPSCLRTGPAAPFAAHGGLRRSLRSTRLGTSPAGRRGVILNGKGILHPFFKLFPRTLLLLLCLFRRSVWARAFIFSAAAFHAPHSLATRASPLCQRRVRIYQR